MEVTEAIEGWRSIRRFKDERPDREKILKVLEAGRRAPSWENVQPWHFIIIEDQDMKKDLVQLAMGQKFVAKAPFVIAVCGDISAWDKPKNRAALLELTAAGASRATEEIIDNVILMDPVFCVAENGPAMILSRTFEQLGVAYGFLCLEAVNQGLGMCIVGAFNNDVTGKSAGLYEKVKKALNLPDTMYLLALLPIGIPDESPAARPRKPIETITSSGSFGTPV